MNLRLSVRVRRCKNKIRKAKKTGKGRKRGEKGEEEKVYGGKKKKEKEKNVSFVAGMGQKHEWTNGPATILNYVCMTREWLRITLGQTWVIEMHPRNTV